MHADEATLDRGGPATTAVRRRAPWSRSGPGRSPTSARSSRSGSTSRTSSCRRRRASTASPTTSRCCCVNGTKRTTPSRWPDALVIDSDVLGRRRPVAMTRSGLGDLLSTFTAAADWRLAADRRASTRRTRRPRSRCCAPASTGPSRRQRASRTNEPAAVRAAGRGADPRWPGDGDRRPHLAVVGRRAHDQPPAGDARERLPRVAAAARRPGRRGNRCGGRVWAAMRRAAAGRSVRRRAAGRGPDCRRGSRAAFLPLDPTGAVAAECWSAYERKLRWVNAHLGEIRGGLRGLGRPRRQRSASCWPSRPRVAGALRAAGAAATLDEPRARRPAPDAVRWAVANCHLMRDRFTVVDLAEVTGWWTDAGRRRRRRPAMTARDRRRAWCAVRRTGSTATPSTSTARSTSTTSCCPARPRRSAPIRASRRGVVFVTNKPLEPAEAYAAQADPARHRAARDDIVTAARLADPLPGRPRTRGRGC